MNSINNVCIVLFRTVSTLALLTVAMPAQALDWTDFIPPSDQSAQRNAKMYTISLPVSEPYNWPGQWQLRPTQSFALGLGLWTSDVGPDESKSVGLGEGRELVASTSSATLYFQVHPIKSSGFYIGAGAQMVTGTYTVLRPVDGAAFWSDASVEESEGKVSAIYAGPTFGWQWIYNNGFTFGFDISKRKRFMDTLEVTEIESPDAKIYESKIKKSLIPETVGGTLVLGYSF